MAKRAAATASREEPASYKVLVDETLLTSGELEEVLHNAYTEGEQPEPDAPLLPPGMKFAELLLGNWDGFDMASALFDIDASPVATDAPTTAASRIGSGGHVGALDVASVMRHAGYVPQ